LLISFDPLVISPTEFEASVRDLLDRIDSAVILMARAVEIPVCYDAAFAPDLEFVATHNRISVNEAIRYHCSAEYLVYFLGFSPGFPYLGELPKLLVTPRLSTPRVKVPAGSVAIGGSQTGIYPVDSPGGWRIIGRTPARLFQPDGEPPTLLQMGDAVRFRPITREEFDEMLGKEQVGGRG
jgi:inhibitor of KinA